MPAGNKSSFFLLHTVVKLFFNNITIFKPSTNTNFNQKTTSGGRWQPQALSSTSLWNKLRDKILIEICECGRWTKFAKTIILYHSYSLSLSWVHEDLYWFENSLRLKKIEKHWSNGLGPGTGEVGQGGLEVLHLWRHSQKIHISQPKKLFRVQTTRFAESFELLTRSLALTGWEKFPCKATCNLAVFAWTTWINPGAIVLMTTLHLYFSSYWIIVLGRTDAFTWPSLLRHFLNHCYSRWMCSVWDGSYNALLRARQ